MKEIQIRIFIFLRRNRLKKNYIELFRQLLKESMYSGYEEPDVSPRSIAPYDPRTGVSLVDDRIRDYAHMAKLSQTRMTASYGHVVGGARHLVVTMGSSQSGYTDIHRLDPRTQRLQQLTTLIHSPTGTSAAPPPTPMFAFFGQTKDESTAFRLLDIHSELPTWHTEDITNGQIHQAS